MIKLNVEQILAGIELLSVDEKKELKSRLNNVLTISEPESEEGASVHQSHRLSIGGDFQIQGTDIAVDFSQKAMATGEASRNRPLGSVATVEDLQTISAAIIDLKQAIQSSPELNSVEKQTAVVPIEILAEELKHTVEEPECTNPDTGLIDQAVTTLKKLLDGVQTLAEPVKNVSSLLAKAWFVL